MRNDFTEIACVIDRSGSMMKLREDAVGGFNSFIEQQKAVPGDAHVTVVLFNDSVQCTYSGPLDAAAPLNNHSYHPEGTTALLDAIGATIVKVGNRLESMRPEDRPAKVIYAILTDGLENASTEYTREKIFQMIKEQREKYSWEFVFLAANQDAIASATAMGIDPKKAFNFDHTKLGMKAAYADMNREVTMYRNQP